MGFPYLLNIAVNVATFKTRFNIPHDVNIAYYHKGDIKDQTLPWVVFFPLMAILEGGIRFPSRPPFYLGPLFLMGSVPTNVCLTFIG